MAFSFSLSDWNHVAGSSTDPLIQPLSDWLDAEPYHDIMFHTEFSAVTGTLELALQTAPCQDEAMFVNMATLTPTVGTVALSIIRMATATQPLARYARWKLTPSTSAWSASFRIWVTVPQRATPRIFGSDDTAFQIDERLRLERATAQRRKRRGETIPDLDAPSRATAPTRARSPARVQQGEVERHKRPGKMIPS